MGEKMFSSEAGVTREVPERELTYLEWREV